MAIALRQRGMRNIVILDNKSDYRPLLEWYDTEECRSLCRVVRLPTNMGHTALYKSGFLLDHVAPGENYVLTDPDLDLDELPNDFMDILESVQEASCKQRGCNKVGFALVLHDLPDYPIARRAAQHEAEFWERPTSLHLPDSLSGYPCYDAPIDTTFFLGKSRKHGMDAVRVAGQLTVRHLPWYVEADNEIPDDVKNYFKTIVTNTHWSKALANRIGA